MVSETIEVVADVEASEVVMDTREVVVTNNLEVAEVATNNLSRTMEDKWVEAEAAFSKTIKVVVPEVRILNTKLRCVELSKMVRYAVTVTNANMHILNRRSICLLSSNSSSSNSTEALHHNSNKN